MVDNRCCKTVATCCRDQLRRSLAVQTQGRLALDDMRADFQRLTQQLAARKEAPSLASQEASDTAGAPSAPSMHLQQHAPAARLKHRTSHAGMS